MRRWLASKLHMWAIRLDDDWHETTLTHTDGSQVTFCCYWQWTGSWTDAYEFDCNCPEAS